MSFYTSYTNSSDILLNGSILFVTSFTGGFVSFLGCSLIYKSMKDKYQIINYRDGKPSLLCASSTKFRFDSDSSDTELETKDKDESNHSVSLPNYDEYIQRWIIDRNHNDHKGVDEHIPFDFVEELTSNGLVYLTYLKDQKRFHYWSNNTINYNILCAVARKFCIIYGCVDYYLDRYEESQSEDDNEDEANREDDINASDTDNGEVEDEDDYLFLKPKTKEESKPERRLKETKTDISEEEEEDEYIEDRYGRYGDIRPTTPVPKYLVFINKGNLYEWEDIRKSEEKRKQMEKWKNAMMNIGEDNNDSITTPNSIDGHMCNSYADFKDMLQAERKLLGVDESVVHLKTPSPTPCSSPSSTPCSSPSSSPVHLKSLDNK